MVYKQYETIYVQVTRAASNSIHSLLANEVQASVPLTHQTYTNTVMSEAANGEDISNYYSFSVIRNPYDRYVSGYTYLGNIHPGYGNFKSFDEFLDLKLSFLPDWWNNTFSLFRPQWWFLCGEDQETVLVDKLCRFETLAEDWATVATTINTNNPDANIPTTLSSLNASTGRQSWETYFTGSLGQERAQKIETLYEKDFQIFNYSKLTF